MDDGRTSNEQRAIRNRGIESASTVELLRLAKAGDHPAFNVLFNKYVPQLQRWARGRLPEFASDTLETDDLVQDAVLHTLRRLQSFEPQHEGSLHAFLRQAVVNRIRDEVRRRSGSDLDEDSLVDDVFVDDAMSPLDEAIGREAADRYESALQRLTSEERQAIILRVELQLPYAQVASEMKKATADGARLFVARALIRLAAEMGHDERAVRNTGSEPRLQSSHDPLAETLHLRPLPGEESSAVMAALSVALGQDLLLAGPICRATVRTSGESDLLDRETISAHLPYSSLTSDLDRVVLVAVHASGVVRGLTGHVERHGEHLTIQLEPTGVIDPEALEPPLIDGSLMWSFDLALVDCGIHARRA